MNYDACLSCRHYWGDLIDGECHRFPPRETKIGFKATFPRVSAETWCGEHQEGQGSLEPLLG